MPARRFVDPSLAAAMRATSDILLRDMPTLGMLFESLCVRMLGQSSDAQQHALNMLV